MHPISSFSTYVHILQVKHEEINHLRVLHNSILGPNSKGLPSGPFLTGNFFSSPMGFLSCAKTMGKIAKLKKRKIGLHIVRLPLQLKPVTSKGACDIGNESVKFFRHTQAKVQIESNSRIFAKVQSVFGLKMNLLVLLLEICSR